MTLIVGIEHEGAVYMGADCGGWYGDGFEDAHTSPKIFSLPPLVLGGAGTVRATQLVRYACAELPAKIGDDSQGYLVRELVPRIRGVLEAGGSIERENGVENATAEFLVSCGGQLFNVSDRLCVFHNSRGYATAGHPIARAVASGVLAVTAEFDPMRRIRWALEAAENHTDAVRSPFCFNPPQTLALSAVA
jgi:hypothetical protein